MVRFADQAGHNISNGAAVGFFFVGDFGVGRLRGEREHGRVDIDAAHRERQVVKQFAQLAAVVVEHGVGMAGEGVAQGGGRHKRVAVAVAAYPAADLQQLGHFDAGPGGLELVFHAAVKFGQRFKKAERENRHAVVDFAVDGDFEMAGFAGLPQGQQRGVDFAFQFGQRFGAVAIFALRQQGADAAVEIKRGLALHFGGVGSEHGGNVGARKLRLHGGRIDIVGLQLVHGFGQAAFHRGAAGVFVGAAAALVVHVFGDVENLRKQAAGDNQILGLLLI